MGPGSRENAAEILLWTDRLDETLRSSLARTTRTTNPRSRPGRNPLGQITGTLQPESLPSASFIAKRHEVERLTRLSAKTSTCLERQPLDSSAKKDPS